MIELRPELETNQTTGLHINLGTFHPFIKTELRDPETLSIQRPVLDVVKLVALSGDKYLLKQFGRLENQYAKALTPILKGLGGRDFDFKAVAKSGLFDTLRLLNNRLLQMQSDRKVTINLQHLSDKGYIEFRIAGGENYHADKRKVQRTVYRFMQLCAVACDPQAYFKDYMKALYRIFVDNTGPMAINMMPYKTPIPKNPDEAIWVLEIWSRNNGRDGYGALPAKELLRMTDARIGKPFTVMDVMSVLSGLDESLYPKVDNGVLQAIRLLMLYAVKDDANPKASLIEIWNKHRDALMRFGAPKLMRNKPNWMRFLYTGSSSVKTITASDLYGHWITEKGEILDVPTGKYGHGGALKDYNGKHHILDGLPAFVQPDGGMLGLHVRPLTASEDHMTPIEAAKQRILANDPERKRGKSLAEQGKPDFIVIYRAVSRAQINFMPDDYVTLSKRFAVEHAQSNAEVNDEEQHVIKTVAASADVFDAFNPGEYFYGGKAKRGKVVFVAKPGEYQEFTGAAEASQPYTNKSKTVKLVFYANRSTAQTCKPGQTVKGKAGYGKRTRVRSATPAEIAQLKKGVWLRTREDNKKATDPKAKRSKYRPHLTADIRTALARLGV